MTTLNAHDYSVGEILTAATMDGVTSDLNTLLTEVEGSCYIEASEYTGDGTTGQTVTLTDTDLVIKAIFIQLETVAGGSAYSFQTTSSFITSDAQGLTTRSITGSELNVDDAVASMGTGSFVVDDNGDDSHPNKNGSTYHYVVLGTH